ncbi:MAG: DUF2147 domain-containing protein [Bacteroides sp.]|nr:DUF2147 domain-containing protein [Bacteroides sp.]MCM1086040.1 DUF2147 domain-containing protein [Bacteroides sp.]
MCAKRADIFFRSCRVLAFVAFICLSWSVQARDKNKYADDLLGTYAIYEHGRQVMAHLNFYKADDGTYEARIVWLDQPDDDLGKPKTDVNNPKRELRHIPLTHVVIVRDLRYDARNYEWEGGRIYDPSTGKTYRCFIRFEDEDTIRVKAYVGIIGFRFIGRSFYWTRVS